MYPVNSSGVKSATTQICTMRGFLGGLDMISPDTGTATLTLYDSENTDTINKLILAEMEVDAGMPSCNHEYTNMVVANRGIYAVLTDTSGTATFVVRYALG